MPTERKGQETLYEVGSYFDKKDVKPPTDDPEKITLQNAPETIKAVDRYFSQGEAYELEIFFLLLFPAIVILIFLYFSRKSSSKEIDLDKIPEKDMDFIEMVRLQKGLEEFDRDFLLQLSFENSVKPIYQLLIDKNIFEQVEKTLISRQKEKEGNTSRNKRLNYLRSLKLKLFG
ncbi:MAG: hypothetical protein ACQETH_04720 [Candidatus Rifleibacteriota bacterium]